jgi:hypothetical protein
MKTKDVVKHWFIYLFVSVTMISFSSCGDDDNYSKNGDQTNNQGLSSLNGHSVDFYYDYEGKLYRAMSISISNEGEFTPLCYDAEEMMGEDDFSYTTDGDNTAYLEMDVNYASTSGKEYQTLDFLHIYELSLTFTSTNQGYADGRVIYSMLYNGSLIKVFNNLNWYFIVDSSGLPDKESIDESMQTQAQNAIEISECTVDEVTASSATAKGTITVSDDVTIQEQGICYATHATPSISDNKERSNTNVINAELSKLSAETTYYVRLYAIVEDKIHYGKIASFTTKKNTGGGNTTESKALQVRIGSVWENRVDVRGIYPNPSTVSSKDYITAGFCLSTTPNPTITDITTSELTWKPDMDYNPTAIPGLSKGTTYYIRPYHVDKSNNKITYYQGTSFQTVGDDIKLTLTVDPGSGYANIDYDIKIPGYYKITLTYFRIAGIWNIDLGYVSGGKGTKGHNGSAGLWNLYMYGEVYFTDIGTGTDTEYISKQVNMGGR